MILLWGVAEDPPLAAVRRLFDERGEEYEFLDQRRLPGRYRFAFGSSPMGFVGSLDLARVRAAYVRPFDYGMLPEHASADDAATRIPALRRFANAMTTWLEVAPALVVNRLSSQASNTSKLYQLMLIREHGFDVPRSLATTDPEAARAFVDRHGAVVYKSLSSVRSIVRRVEAEQLERLDDVRHCPTLFQEYVPGTDYRVHVVGDRVFANMIWSEGDDYRYDDVTEQVAVELPDDVGERCVRLTRALGLPFSGVDLRRGGDGAWFCFEVNPSPGFPYFDADGSARIGNALVDLLCSQGGARLVPSPRAPAV